jgi:thioredoxin 1
MVAYITELDSQNYSQFTSSGNVLIDIYASWCGPCRIISPIVDEISGIYQGKISVGKLDADKSKEILADLGVRNIPTLLFYKNGQLVKDENGNVEKLVGSSITKQKLTDFIDKHLQ